MIPKGILMVDKPIDWTSFDVVNYIKSYLSINYQVSRKTIKIGHSGTLDPFATGLLIILIGRENTKLAAHFLGLDKTYLVKAKLGFISDTFDRTGQVKFFSNIKPTQDDVIKNLKNFLGIHEQTPPEFSAIKINGRRAYELARQGQTIEMKKRTISIKDINLLSFEYPFVEFVVQVSSGTYIRSLVNDLGLVLKSGALTEDLRRTKINDFDVKNALKVNEIKQIDLKDFETKIFSSIEKLN
jgi:tRNA pseudouridine55 synthase